jgi:multidrug efflux system outer membrane protein
LLRRPDLFAAERNLAAANADIGIAEAAYYPNFRLRAGGGFDGASMSNLISTDNIVWSLGSSLTYPILGQKNIRAQRDATVARHQALTAEYKQSVLVALREAEDALTGLDFLRRQEDAQNQAIKAAENTLTISRERFSAGLVSFLEVVETERTLLATKRQAASLRTQRLALTVNLIKALGGSW